MSIEPTRAEVTRTLLYGRLPGVLDVADSPGPLPVCHATDCAGLPMVLSRDGDTLARAVLGHRSGQPWAVLTVADVPPVDGAPSLGRAQVLGRLRRLDDRKAAHAVAEFAAANPVTDLFDVGHGVSVYLLDPDRVRLTHGRIGGPVDLDDYIGAGPDPLHEEEGELLRDLAGHHAVEIDGYFRRHLVAAGVPCPSRPRAVRLDRYGFVLEVAGTVPGWVRLNFPRPVRDRRELADLLHPVLFHQHR